MKLPQIPPAVKAIVGIIIMFSLTMYIWNHQFVSYWQNINEYWAIVAIIAILSSTLLGTINLLILLPLELNISLKKLLPAFWFAWAFGLIFPGQIGDVASLSTWLAQQGVNWPLTLSRVLLDKIISLSTVILFSLLGIVILFNQENTYLTPINLLIALIIVLIALIFIIKKLSMIPATNKNIVLSSLQTTATFIIQSPKKIIINIILSIVKFILIGVAYWAVFKAINIIHLELTSVTMLVATSSLVAYIPISFNGLGTVELAGVALFLSQDIPAEAIVTTYLLLRLIVLSLAWFPVLVWFFFIKKSNAV